MKRKHRRLTFILTGLVLLGAAAGLVLVAFEDNLVFFYSPTDLIEKDIPEGRRFRIGGLVEEGSVIRLADGLTVSFRSPTCPRPCRSSIKACSPTCSARARA